MFGVPPWRHQLELFLCYCAVNKLLSGTGHLRLCYGKPRVELVRKPSLTLCGVCGEPSGASCKGALIPAVKGSSGGSVTARVTPGWSH